MKNRLAPTPIRTFRARARARAPVSTPTTAFITLPVLRALRRYRFDLASLEDAAAAAGEDALGEALAAAFFCDAAWAGLLAHGATLYTRDVDMYKDAKPTSNSASTCRAHTTTGGGVCARTLTA